jgi:YD repeat-containing protein
MAKMKSSKTWLRPIRNLLVFGLCIAGLVKLWSWNRQRSTTAFAIAHLRGDASPPQWDGTYPCVSASLANNAIKTSLGRCEISMLSPSSFDDAEVDLRYGAFVLRQTDMQLDDARNFPLTRAYNSQDWLGTNHVHAFGSNSNHLFDIAPLGTTNPYTEMTLVMEDGDFLYFKRISPGTGFADAVYQQTETSGNFYKATINWNGDGWALRLRDGTEILFPESYMATSLAQGAPTEIHLASGNRIKLQRDFNRNLRTVSTQQGHSIRFTYDDQSRITKVEDDKGNWVRYEYGSDRDDMLLAAIRSSGEERHYQYQGVLMTTITNERGVVLLRNAYASGVLTRQEYGNGDTYEFSYTWNAKRTYTEKAIVTLPDHSAQEVPTADSVSGYLKR